MPETATIPETVTVPGQVFFDAIVALEAVSQGLEAIAGVYPGGPLGEAIGERRFELFKAAFGDWFVTDDLDRGPEAEQLDRDARALLYECFGLEEASA